MGNTKGVERKKERKQRQENEKKGKQLHHMPDPSTIECSIQMGLE